MDISQLFRDWGNDDNLPVANTGGMPANLPTPSGGDNRAVPYTPDPRPQSTFQKWASGGYKDQIQAAMARQAANPASRMTATAPSGWLMPSSGIISAQQPGQGLFRQSFGGYRADGGPIKPRKRYIVGENGPEEIVLDKPGVVIPTGQTEPTNPGSRLFRPMANDSAPASAPASIGTFNPDAVDRLSQIGDVASRGERYQPVDQNAVRDLGQIGNAAAAGQRYAFDPSTNLTPAERGSVERMANMPVADPKEFQNAPPPRDLPPPQAVAPVEEPVPPPPPLTAEQQAAKDKRSRLIRHPSEGTWDQIQALNKPTGDKPSLFKRLFGGMKEAGSNWQAGPGSGGLLGFLFHGLAGGINAAASPGDYDQMKRENKQSRLIRQYQNEVAHEQTQDGFTNTDIAQNNARLKPVLDQQKIDDARAKENDLDVARQARIQESRVNGWRKRHPYFDPAKATPADVGELAAMGLKPEDMGKYDFSKPNVKQVGDTQFQWNGNEGVWMDSGMPKQKDKAYTELTLKDPDTGKESTFVTTQEKAAQYLNARVVGNMQITAAKDRQLSQQTFQDEQTKLKIQAQKEAEILRAALAETKAQKDEGRRIDAQKRADASRERLLRLRGLITDPAAPQQ